MLRGTRMSRLTYRKHTRAPTFAATLAGPGHANPRSVVSAVYPLRLVAPVLNRKAATLARRQANPVARAILASIGDKLIRRVVRRIVIQGVVQLPDIRRAGRLVNRLPRRLVAARLRTVVHDGRLRPERLHHRRRTR